MLPVVLRNGTHSVHTYALLDTGADTCLFHADFARRIRLRLKAGRKEQRGGIDPATRITCYCHVIDLTVGSMRSIRCEVAFSEDVSDDVLDQLVGRETVFDTFRFAVRQGVDFLYIGNKP
jgi:hypothetical protein